MVNSNRIIGVVGFAGSGKDTVAEHLVADHNFVRDSFASSLKDAMSAVLGWDRQLLEGLTKESRDWREQVDTWWAARLGIPNFTPRWVMQNWGTDLFRNKFHPDLWIASLERRLANTCNPTVISDCRFPNEIAALKELGAKIIWVRKPNLPSWYDLAISACQGSASSARKLQALNIHPSEWLWIDTKFDNTIVNDSDLDSLYSKVDLLLKSSKVLKTAQFSG